MTLVLTRADKDSPVVVTIFNPWPQCPDRDTCRQRATCAWQCSPVEGVIIGGSEDWDNFKPCRDIA